MKLFERTPTGRPKRLRERKGSYSKTDKPLLHRFKRGLASKKGRFVLMACICICFTFLLILFFIPSSLADPSSPSSSSPSIDSLLENIQSNPENVNMGHISELLSHRNDLEKYLNGIDNLLVKHKDQIYKHLDLGNTSQVIPREQIDRIKRLKQEVLSEDVIEDDSVLLDAAAIRKEIVSEFKYAYNAYKECAFGYDTVHPISCKGTNDAFDLGLGMIDALDTTIIMAGNEDNDPELLQNILDIRTWITNEMRFDRKKEVSLFESTIRVLGGLLSAYSLTNDTIYLSRATELGDKLIVAFDTESGIPFSSVNFVENRGFNPGWSRSATSTSEVASIQLEFNYLSVLSGDPKYYLVARHAQDLVIRAQRQANPPLCRKWINIKSQTFNDNKISFGSRVDSTYEYYLKVALQLGRHSGTADIWNIYMESIATAEKELFARTAANNRLYLIEKNGKSISDQFDHLVCFIGGVLALGSLQTDNPYRDKHLEFGKELTETCFSIYISTNTGLAPEIVYFSRTDSRNDFTIHARDKHNLLRPETVESIFYLYRITNNEKYRKWGYQILTAFRKWTKIPKDVASHGGYASINDVTVTHKSKRTFRDDKMESFFLSETLKYLYLLFCDDNVIPIDRYVFNTEGHPLPIISKETSHFLFK